MGFAVHAQEYRISGQIIDFDTKEGISGATVSVSPTVGTITDSAGYFTVPVKKYPV